MLKTDIGPTQVVSHVGYGGRNFEVAKVLGKKDPEVYVLYSLESSKPWEPVGNFESVQEAKNFARSLSGGSAK